MHRPMSMLLMGAAACALLAGAAQAKTPAKGQAMPHAAAQNANKGAKPGAIFEHASPLFLQAPQFD